MDDIKRPSDAWVALDASLTERFLGALLALREPVHVLRNALHDAITEADAPPAMVARWSTMLDLVLKAETRPSVIARPEPMSALLRLYRMHLTASAIQARAARAMGVRVRRCTSTFNPRSIP